MFLGLRTTIYPVGDLAAATVWYSRALGIAPYFDQPYYVGFSVGGFELGLVPDGQPGTHGAQAYWGVDDADAAMVHLVGLGAMQLDAVNDVGDGIRVGSVIDPFGNRLDFIQNPHFKLAEVR